jgi:amino acid adenylation domain-containing protein
VSDELALLTKLRGLGVRVWADEGRLRYAAPTGVLTPELRAELTEGKSALLALVEQVANRADGATREIRQTARHGEPVPLSYAQRRMLFLQRLAPNEPNYSMPTTLRLRGRVDAAALRQAYRDIVATHEILRCRLVAGEEPRQIVVDDDPPWRHVRVGGWDQARLLAVEEAQRPFDLVNGGQLVRCLLVSTEADEHVLVLNLHHCVADGWSLDILLRQLADRYTGRPDPLPAPRIDYLDYVAWEQQCLNGRKLKRELEFWRTALDGAPTILDLPTDHRRPSHETFAGFSRTTSLPSATAAAVRELARRENATPYMVLLAAYGVLLRRCSGQDDLLIGAPTAGRGHPDTHRLVGLFVNTLPLRVDLSGEPTFVEALRRVRRTVLAARDHEDLPYDLLVEHLQPTRAPGRNPLFQTMFVHQAHRPSELDFGTVTAEHIEVDDTVAKVDLTLLVEETAADGLVVRLTAASALFGRSTVDRLLTQLGVLSRSATADPDCPIDGLDLIGDQALPARPADPPEARTAPDTTLPQLIAQQAVATPSADAVVFDGFTLSYQALAARIERLAAALASCGVRPGSIVGVAIPRSAELVVALCAVLRAGGAYLPIDQGLPARRVAFMIEDAQPELVLSTADVNRLIGERAADPPGNSPTPGDPAYVIYTSGSTGTPKGVVVGHGAVCNRLLWMRARYGIGAGDRVLQKTPTGFDVSVWELFLPLISGATLVLAEPGGHRDPAYLDRLLRQERITTVHFVPSMLRAFLAEPTLGLFPALRQVICSGEELTVDLQTAAIDRFGARLHNLYGPTEAAIDVSHWECLPDPDAMEVPIGYPVWNTGLRVLDARLRPVPPGVIGELYLTGAQLALGYLNRPELTAQRFLTGPEGQRMYRTGDLARLRADGAVVYCGRIDDQVKIRGQRGELGEVEAVISGHAGTSAVAVAAKPDPHGGARLVAYLVPDTVHAAPVRGFARLERAGELPGLRRYRLPNGMAVYARSQVEADHLYRHEHRLRGIQLPVDAQIVDIGAHVGLFALFAALACPHGVVYACEPDPQLFAALRANTAAYDVAVKTLSSGVADPVHAEPVEYPTHPLSAVLDDRAITRVDLLKIGVEKGEWDVLRSVRVRYWPIIRQVVVEVFDVDGCLDRVVDLLTGHGLTVISQTHGTGQVSVHARRPDLRPLPPRQVTPPRWSDPAGYLTEVRALARATLPEHMVPNAFVVLDELPLTASGKLDREALPEPHGVAEVPSRGPRTPVEDVLCGLVAEVLGLPTLGAEEDFFELGGHSLLVFRLVARIRAVLGVDLGVGAVFAACTPAALAGLVEGTVKADPFGVMLPLRSGGVREPLFCLHPAAGISWSYAGLLRHVDPAQPVYGIQDPCLTGESGGLGVTDLADHYVAGIRAVQGTGPYHLLGWSFGGLVAHAVATRLRSEGERVDLLAIVDTTPFDVTVRTAPPDQTRALRGMLESLGHQSSEVRYVADAVRVLERAGSVLAGLGEERLDTMARAFTDNSRRAEQFVPAVFDGDITLVTTGDPESDTIAWLPYATGRVVAHRVDCAHGELMDPGPLTEVAAALGFRL